MANPRKPRDTSPLNPSQLSDDELRTIHEIERRLDEAKDADMDDAPKGAGFYLAQGRNKDPRVLLLDGGRGTGKTSLLLTLIERWHLEINESSRSQDYIRAIKSAYKERAEGFQGTIMEPRTNIKVLDIIDFDPLPPGMPLIAGLMQAWRSLAQNYDQQLEDSIADYGDQEGTLMDIWHGLFRTAAVGWGAVPENKGLIEQVLDREDQVQDWKRLDEQWRSFVTKVIQRGRKLQDPQKLSSETVFVVMIDDVDLQVGRIRELLHALRMLDHPKVFFIVAADRRHMIDMLTLDFYGQQNAISLHRNSAAGHAIDLVATDRWAGILAQSSVEKVFPLMNRWPLRPLLLHELLEFPRKSAVTLQTLLNGWHQQEKPIRDFGSLGDYLARMAGTADDPIEFPPILPYRAAHQIIEHALAQHNNGSGNVNNPKMTEATEQGDARRALDAIRHIIGRPDPDSLLRVTKSRNDATADKRRLKKGQRRTLDPTIEYRSAGELVALFPKGFGEPLKHDNEIVLSARPGFLFFHGSTRERITMSASGETDSRLTSALIASSLREDGYGVVAPGLVWNIRLALAWTEVRLSEGGDLSIDLALQWKLQQHPSPLQLLNWSKDWRDFIHDLSRKSEYRLERIAYAWIYYQLKWMGSEGGSQQLKGLPEPLNDKFNNKRSWDTLLAQMPETGTPRDKKLWHTWRLPLMARPELGLKHEVQQRLLSFVSTDEDIKWLKDQRRRLITDAILAAADQVGASAVDAENQERADRIADVFDRHYRAIEGKESPWYMKIERHVPRRNDPGNNEN
jgi:hypothetical protein